MNTQTRPPAAWPLPAPLAPDNGGLERHHHAPAGPAGWVWLLSRPLATDEHRARFWVRHVRLGVAASELAGLLVVGYAFAAGRPHASTLAWLAVGTMLSVPALLAVPMSRLSRDHRGALVFYAWSAAMTAVICTTIVVDGGATSPLAWLLMLTLTFAGLAYPPAGVALMGSVMITGYLAAASSSGSIVLAQVGVTAGTLTLFTVMIAWASRNQWDMADQQNLLTQQLATLADTDALTGCLNRRAFHDRLQAALRRADPAHPVSMCLLDLDGFKAVNDTHGHAAGDQVLLATARALLSAARETDSVTRLGGDEFAVLLPATSAAAAAAAGLRLQDRLAGELSGSGRPCGVTASIGIATTDQPVTHETFLSLADQLMYEAKSLGRNQIRQQH